MVILEPCFDETKRSPDVKSLQMLLVNIYFHTPDVVPISNVPRLAYVIHPQPASEYSVSTLSSVGVYDGLWNREGYINTAVDSTEDSVLTYLVSANYCVSSH